MLGVTLWPVAWPYRHIFELFQRLLPITDDRQTELFRLCGTQNEYGTQIVRSLLACGGAGPTRGVACVSFPFSTDFLHALAKQGFYIILRTEEWLKNTRTPRRLPQNTASNNQYFWSNNNNIVTPPCPPQLVHRNSVTQDGLKSSRTWVPMVMLTLESLSA